MTLAGISELQNVQFRISSNALDKGIAFDLTGQSSQGPVAVNGELFGLFTQAPTLKAAGGVQNGIQVTVEELVMPKPLALETMQLKAELQASTLYNFHNLICNIDAQNLENIDVQLHSDTLSTAFIGSLKRDPLSPVIKKPMAFDSMWSGEDSSANYVDQVVLLKTALLKVQVEPLTLPLQALGDWPPQAQRAGDSQSITLGSANKKSGGAQNALVQFISTAKRRWHLEVFPRQAFVLATASGMIQAEVPSTIRSTSLRRT